MAGIPLYIHKNLPSKTTGRIKKMTQPIIPKKIISFFY